MDYDEALAFWHGRIDYERRQPRPGDLKLDRMRALLRRLGDPHHRFRCVHVAGTKGKGSTAAMLAAILRAAGHHTGLFTSPHLADISERVQVDGVPIARDDAPSIATSVTNTPATPSRAPCSIKRKASMGRAAIIAIRRDKACGWIRGHGIAVPAGWQAVAALPTSLYWSTLSIVHGRLHRR